MLTQALRDTLTFSGSAGHRSKAGAHINALWGSPDVNTYYDHIYLSPHLDDAVLSCGGHIWQQRQAGERVLVVTIFASAPASSAQLSPFARRLHTRWGHVVHAVAERREENLAALALLDVRAKHWPYPDCIYRRTPDGRFPYASEEALWGEIHPTEEALVKALTTQLQVLPLGRDGTVYAPLGVGHHVDHQIVRRAVEASIHTPIFYEDFPYAENPRAVQAALEEGRWQARLVPLSEETLETKIAAIACYHSQLSTFWADLAEMAAAVRSFAEQTGGSGLAERYWRSTLSGTW